MSRPIGMGGRNDYSVISRSVSFSLGSPSYVSEYAREDDDVNDDIINGFVCPILRASKYYKFNFFPFFFSNMYTI